MKNILYHGTSSEEFNTPRTPFHLTSDLDRAERFSLRGNGYGPRRILSYRIIENPRLFCYKNETVLEKACGQEVCADEDSSRYATIAQLLEATGEWDGYYMPDLEWYCLFNNEYLRLENTEYLSETE